MPMSVPGAADYRPPLDMPGCIESKAASIAAQPPVCRAARQQGFTLLEMMIVLVIIGIATSLASISAFGNSDARALRQDALRLAQLFTAAQVEARASGQSIVWQYDAEGYRFTRLPRQLILPARLAARGHRVEDPALATDSVLRPRQWAPEQPVIVRMAPQETLVFDADWIASPLKMELVSGDLAVTLARLGNGRFVVQQ